VKILVAGLGWAMAELVLTRLVFLWVGARGVEFDWRYIQAFSSQPLYLIGTEIFFIIRTSVRVFGPPGSGSGSISQRYESGSFYH
jgi:hypothetical protein